MKLPKRLAAFGRSHGQLLQRNFQYKAQLKGYFPLKGEGVEVRHYTNPSNCSF
jgi:hypothetical protein